MRTPRLSWLVLCGMILIGSLVMSARYALADEAPAADPAATEAPPTLEERVGNLESEVTNSAPVAAKGALANTSGPGHNAWMMTSTALVLFMTLPGLALFYGGLVRRKNILSVVAQCFGCAGLVTIMWWAVGYSFVFDHGGKFLGGFHFTMLKGVGTAP